MATTKDLVEGLNILKKYTDLENDYFACEHDIIYLPGKTTGLDEKDKKRLDELGFFIDEEEECWAKFS